MHGKLDECRMSTPASAARILVWLGTPQAAGHFDAAALQPAERQRFSTLRSARRREEFKISRALRAHACSTQDGAESLSHSAGHAAVATGPAELLIGVDLEQHRSRDELAIARATFSPREAAALQALERTQRTRAFYALWTMKEALAKALQLDLLDALRRCEFLAGPESWQARVPAPSCGRVTVFEPAPRMSLAVAYVGSAACLPIRAMHWPPERESRWPVIAEAGFFPPAPAAPAAAAP